MIKYENNTGEDKANVCIFYIQLPKNPIFLLKKITLSRYETK